MNKMEEQHFTLAQSEKTEALKQRDRAWLRRIWNTNRVTFISAMFFGLLAYLWFFTNKITNYDDIHYLFSKGASLDSGRWGLDIISLFIPDFSLPWLWGIFSLAILSIALCEIVNIMGIQSDVLKIGLAGAVITFASETDIMLFMYTAPCYAVAFLLSVLAVKFLVASSKPRGILLAAVLEIFAVSIYQAFLLVSSSLLIIFLVKFFLLSEQYSFKLLLRKSFSYLAFLAISVAVYLGVMLVLQRVENVSFNHYTATAFSYNTDSIPVRIKNAYYIFARIFLIGQYDLIRTPLTKLAHIILVGASLLFGLRLCLASENGKSKSALFLLFSVVLLPLSISGMFLIVASGKIHSIVMFSFITEYVFVAVLLDMFYQKHAAFKCARSVPNLAGILLAIIVLDNIFFANKTALRQYMEFENTYSILQSVITQVQLSPEYDSTCKIALVGDLPESAYKQAFHTGSSTLFGITDFRNDYSRADFISYYLGFDAAYAETEELEKINSMAAFKQMPSYPYYGCIKRIDDYLVVKFSDYVAR